MCRMKKLVSLLLCVLLCALSCTALAVEYNANNIFTITYDEEAYAFDNQTYLNENTSTYSWMFMLYQEALDVVVDVEMEYVEEFRDLTLFSATAEERSRYMAATLDSLSDQNIQLVDTFTISDLNIPFYLFSMTDSDGSYLTAETVVGGWIINFSTYHTENPNADEALLSVMEEIVTTFAPIVK